MCDVRQGVISTAPRSQKELVSTSTRVAMVHWDPTNFATLFTALPFTSTHGGKLKHAKEKDVTGRIVNSQATSKQLHSHTHSTAAVAHNECVNYI